MRAAHPIASRAAAAFCLLASGGATGVGRGCDFPLPAPFDRVDHGALMRLLYPAHDEETDALGVSDEEGTALAGGLYEARLLRDRGVEELVVLVETWKAGITRDEVGDASYGIDLALFELRDGAPALRASLRDASRHGGQGAAHLMLGARGITSGDAAIGIESTHAQGATLRLFQRQGTTFRMVMEREALESFEGAAEDDVPGLSTPMR